MGGSIRLRPGGRVDARRGVVHKGRGYQAGDLCIKKGELKETDGEIGVIHR